MAKYYVKVVGRAFGPIDAEKIVQMVADGKLTRESEVSANRLDWRTIGEVDELRQALSVGLPTAAPFNGVGIGASDAKVWYVTNDGVTQYGPMTQNEVLRALQSGQIQPTASAWRDGEQARPISDIPAFRTQNVAPVEKKEWYYSPDGQTGYGPYGVSDILAFVEQGRANFDTLVWRLGENSRPMRNEPAFMNAYNAMHGGMTANVYPSSAAVAEVEPLSREEALAINARLRRWHNLMWISYATSAFTAVLGLGLLIMSFYFSSVTITPDTAVQSILALGVAGIISSFIELLATIVFLFSFSCHYFFIHCFWKSIPKRYARSTPDQAVGFLFIPIFNLYWYFVAFQGGLTDFNRAVADFVRSGRNNGEQPIRVGTTGGMIVAISWIVCHVAPIPLAFLSFLILPFFLLPIPIFLFPLIVYFCTMKMKKAAIQLNLWRSGGASRPQNSAGPRVTLDDLIRS